MSLALITTYNSPRSTPNPTHIKTLPNPTLQNPKTQLHNQKKHQGSQCGTLQQQKTRNRFWKRNINTTQKRKISQKSILPSA
jgi:hypothetical protein